MTSNQTDQELRDSITHILGLCQYGCDGTNHKSAAREDEEAEIDQILALIKADRHKRDIGSRIDELKHRRKRFELEEQVKSRDGHHLKLNETRNAFKLKERSSIDDRIAHLEAKQEEAQ